MDNRNKNVKDKYEYIFVCEFNGFVCYFEWGWIIINKLYENILEKYLVWI